MMRRLRVVRVVGLVCEESRRRKGIIWRAQSSHSIHALSSDDVVVVVVIEDDVRIEPTSGRVAPFWLRVARVHPEVVHQARASNLACITQF